MKRKLFFYFAILFGIISCKSKSDEKFADKYSGFQESYNKGGIIVLRNEDSIKACQESFLKPDTSIFAKTPYRDIWKYNDDLRNVVDPKRCGGSIPWGLENFPLSIKMDINKRELGRLIKARKSDNLLGVFGIDHNKRFTISFILLDERGEVDSRHLDEALEGEETWPASSVTFVGISPEDAANRELPIPRKK